MSPEFARWLEELVSRHKRAIFVQYSTMLHRWEHNWWWIKREQEKAKCEMTKSL